MIGEGGSKGPRHEGGNGICGRHVELRVLLSDGLDEKGGRWDEMSQVIHFAESTGEECVGSGVGGGS